MDLYGAQAHIVRRLQEELSPKLTYHSVRHSVDVLRFAEVLALAEGIADEGLPLLQTAAIYHDAGFLVRYEKNEPIACDIVRVTLPKYDYNESQINVICDMIMATQIPQQPKSHLAEILCDADLDYLGTPDFEYWGNKLREELANYGKSMTDEEWYSLEVSFLESHSYFTDSSKQIRDACKTRNLTKVRDLLLET